MKQKSNRHPLKTALIFVVVIGSVATGYFGSIALFQYFNPEETTQATPSNREAYAGLPDAALEATDETELPRGTLNDYKVAADMPRFLSIAKINLKARILPMGINSEGAVQAPVNIYDSGWYKGGAKPGTPGASFIDAHASGSTRQGLFAYLDTLKNGDTVSVEQGDGEIFNYKVVQVETVARDAVDMDKALKVYGGASEGLNLMTCTGKWIANEKTYDKRVVVYTERV